MSWIKQRGYIKPNWMPRNKTYSSRWLLSRILFWTTTNSTYSFHRQAGLMALCMTMWLKAIQHSCSTSISIPSKDLTSSTLNLLMKKTSPSSTCSSQFPSMSTQRTQSTRNSFSNNGFSIVSQTLAATCCLSTSFSAIW